MAERLTTRLFIIALSLVAFPAYAQADAGDGFKSGAFSLTPGLNLRSAYDSNVFYESTDETTPTGAASVSVEPFFRIDTEAANNLQLYLDSSVAWQQYLASDAASEQSGLSADLGVGAGFNTQGAFSFRIEDRLIRTNEPPSNPTNDTYNRFTNRLGITAGLHPGGRALQHYLSYDWFVYRHDPLTDLNRMTHNFGLKNYWLFLPKTSAVLSAEYSITSYDQAARNAGPFVNSNSSPLRITGGLSGLVTNRIAVRLIGGYGWSFHDAGASHSGMLVDARGTWYFGNISADNSLFLGYARNFGEATLANFYTWDKPYAGYSQGLLNNRLRLTANVSAAFRSYGETPQGVIAGPSGDLVLPTSLSDTLVSADAGATFNLTKWWSAGLRYGLHANFNDDVVVTTNTAASDARRDYLRHVITVETTVRY